MLIVWQKTLCEKDKNAGDQHFCPFPTLFSKGVFFRVAKYGIDIFFDTVISSFFTKVFKALSFRIMKIGILLYRVKVLLPSLSADHDHRAGYSDFSADASVQ